MKKFIRILALLGWAGLTGVCVVLARGLLNFPPRPAVVVGIVAVQILWIWWQPCHHQRKEGGTTRRPIWRLVLVTIAQGVVLALAPWETLKPAVLLAGAGVVLNYLWGGAILGVRKTLQDQNRKQTFEVRDEGAVEAGVRLLTGFQVAILVGEVLLSYLWLAKS